MYDLDFASYVLKINPGSFTNDPAYNYEFKISTAYLKSLYTQNILLSISKFDVIPIVTIL